MTIFEVAEMLSLDIVTRRYSGQGGRIVASFSCTSFEGSSIVEFKDKEGGGVLSSSHGSAFSYDAALENFCEEISGKILIINVMGKEKTEYKLPDSLTLKD